MPDPSDTAATADASWSAVLQYAHVHRLQFGTDIVFTYGPLGFLATPYASSASLGRLLTDFLLSLLGAVGICLVATHLRWVRRVALIGVYLFLLSNTYPRADLLLEVNLLCWALLCTVGVGRNLAIYVSVLASVAAFAALVKITLLLIACWTLAVISCCLVFRGYRLLSRILPALALVCFIAGWMIAGQSPLNLGTFLARALITSQGYNSAMGYEGSVVLRGRGLLTGLLAIGAVFTASLCPLRQRCKASASKAGAETTTSSTIQRGFLFCWACATLFLVWKHGFVRTDLYHAGFFFGFAPILALVFGGLTPQMPNERRETLFRITMLREGFRKFPGPKFWETVFTTVCCIWSLLTVQTMILPGDWKNSFLEPLRSLPTNFSHLVQPSRYRDQLRQPLEAERHQYQLPALRLIAGRATVDMFGCEQMAVLANDFNYRPRPVFQTYAAYSSPLMRWNERFYQSSARPEFVLFRLMAMDRKFPSLEDALLLRNLLINYEPAGSEGAFLLLKSARNETASLNLLREGTFQIGERLSLSEFGETNLWLELDLEPTLIGYFRQFFYQPAKSRLLVWSSTSADAQALRFRAPPLMLAAGFLLSPLQLNTDDVLRLYQGREAKRPSAIGIEINPGDEELWRKTVRFRLYRLHNHLGAIASRNS
ncbi:MAG TPA: hypothetical protein VL361_21210 [Candidatus Limnocylindrales bacterium]|nr:hypothetical protein [Candidatus Limnocylindrales bacterium]